jgi:hypothetical protein
MLPTMNSAAASRQSPRWMKNMPPVAATPMPTKVPSMTFLRPA